MERFRLLLQVGGNLIRFILSAHRLVFPDDRLHGNQVDDAEKFRFLSDGNLNRDRLGTETFAVGIDGMLEIRTHLVSLINGAYTGNTVLVGRASVLFRLRL